MKLSANKESAWYHGACRYIEQVFLDGVLLKNVTDFDQEAGTVTRYVTTDSGDLSVVDGLMETQTLTGVVNYSVHPDHVDNPCVKDWEDDPRYR